MAGSFPFSAADAKRLEAWFSGQPWFERIEKPWTTFAFRVKGETLAWSYYPKKGVLVEEGKPGAMGEAARGELAAKFPLLAAADAPAGAPAAGVKRPALYPYIGGDESGKGDTFGPLTVAACRLDAREEELLLTLGVRDSKLIADGQIRKLAGEIRQVIPHGFCVREWTPALYNAAIAGVQREGGNLNTLLGRSHGECIRGITAGAPAAWVIVDQFGNPKYLKSELPRGMPFATEPRAEAYPAVAAASILAREACLLWFDREKAAGREWPRGSSDPRIVPLLKRVCADEGSQALWKYAKVHFASVQKVIAGG